MAVLKAADLFCGAGGTSSGAELSGAARVRFALNHWGVAVETHSANFPHARHVNSRLDQCKPSECGKIDLLFASPECIHHSRARGGRPTSDQQRSGAWELMPWIEYHRPSWIVVENVVEFEEWGPVGKDGRPLSSMRGKMFAAWVAAIEAAGYRVEWRRLNAADYGAATSRTRLFVVARKGRRSFAWPDPTHARQVVNRLPGMELSPWRAAWEIIDWSIPCPSIFARKRPLADKTLLRIEAGLRRFVGPFVHSTCGGGVARSAGEPIPTITARGGAWLSVPFLAQWDNQGGNGRYIRSSGEPLHTLTTKANAGVAVPFVVPRQGFYEPHVLKRCRGTDEPLPTITASHVPGAVAVPYIVPYRGEREGQDGRTHDAGDPLPTIATAKGHGVALPFLAEVNHGGVDHRTASPAEPLGTVTRQNGRAVVVPFLTQHYGSGGQWSAIDGPVPAIVTKDRHSLVTATIDPLGAPPAEPESDAMRTLLATMAELGVVDIGFRMLSNPELSLAQGFPAEYFFAGSKADVTRQIGNSVSPPVARALTEAIAAA